MYQEKSGQSSFWGDPLYEMIIPKDHFLKRLSEQIDFKKVNDTVKDLYSKEMGRPSYEPAMMFKMTYLQFMYNISDRDVEEQVRYNMAYKWFVGLSADELPPDHYS
jgi:transposase